MYIISNALKNLVRNKGRNILISAILLAIVSTTAITLSISNTAESIINDYHTRFGSRVTIAPDMARLFGDGIQPGQIVMQPQVTPQQSLAFARFDSVMEYTIVVYHGANTHELLAVDEPPGGVLYNIGQFVIEGDAAQGFENFLAESILPYFRIVSGKWDEFANGQRVLTEGYMPQADGEAIISSEIAELNNLSVGDVIRLDSQFMSTHDNSIRIIHRYLTVVGIYLDMTVANPFAGFWQSPIINRRNEILTTLNTVIAPMRDYETGIDIHATYYLHNPSYLAAFETEARSLGLDDMLVISVDEEGYYAIVAPILGLRSVTRTFMWVALILGCIVLIFISSIAIRERKYEIGVLRAMGLKKHKIAAGLWTEMLALTTICLTVGLILGSVVSQPISDTLLATQAERLQDDSPGITLGRGLIDFGRELAAETITPIDTLDISLGVGTIVQIIGIALLLASFAAFVAIIRITKYEPIKILMERD